MFCQGFIGQGVQQGLRFIGCHECVPFRILGLYLSQIHALNQLLAQNLRLQKASEIHELPDSIRRQDACNSEQRSFIIAMYGSIGIHHFTSGYRSGSSNLIPVYHNQMA
jgi:hypothetical protein